MRRAWEWVFAPGDPRRLAALRIGLSVVLVSRLARPLYLELAGQPPALFRPRSFMHLLDRMPPRGVVLALQVLGIAAAVLAAAGVKSRVTLPIGFASLLFLGGMHNSLGKIMHQDVMLLLALVPLLAARTGDVWALDARGKERPPDGPGYGWPVRTAMLVVALGYFFTGVAKLRFSGLDWFAGSNLRWVLYASSDAQADPNGFALLIADRAWLAHWFAFGALALECTFPIALLRPRLAPLFVAGAIVMHASIGLAMHLDYSAWAATAAVVLIDWPAVLDRLRAKRRPLSHAVG